MEEGQQSSSQVDQNKVQNFGPPKVICEYCQAMLWYEERAEKSWKPKKPSFSLCCGKGKIKFPLLKEPPSFLRELLYPGVSRQSNKFKENIRSYNSMFAFTSSGGNIDNTYNNGGGPYCFCLNGQNHHRIGSLKPVPGTTSKFCQLYIYDTENKIKNRMISIKSTNKLDEDIVKGLLEMLDLNNVLVKSFRMVRDRINEDELMTVRLVIMASRSGDGREQNMPSASEIAGLIVGNVEETIGIRDIVVDDRKLGLSRISDLHPCFMAMQYPLLFPYGEDGYRLGVKLLEASNNNLKKRKDVTMREYAAFRIQQCHSEGKTLLYSGKLFQTYIVDLFTCIEEDRLHWVKQNQTKIRAELYCGIKDAVFRGDTEGSQVGQRIVLPSSFTGDPRYMNQNYQDAISLCRVMGNLDLFITMTANPRWLEIKATLEEMGGQRSDERPDIVARVFKIKLDQLMEDLQKNYHFGKCVGAVYTIEFQKRGLPHAHILLWLHEGNKYLTPTLINKIISAEIPDEKEDPIGYAAVAQYMMHGPCGSTSSYSSCMKHQKCSKRFPKKYNSETIIDDGGFPIYRRREDNSKWIEKIGTRLDNGYVVPYNRYLIVKYQSHINVEWCNRGRSIKYLFKYVTKGPDHVSVSIHKENNDRSSKVKELNRHEIQHYLDCRYVSAPEAIWRIFGFDIHYRTPAVERLPFHLPDQESIIFKDNDNLNDILNDIGSKQTKFNGWMEANKLYQRQKISHMLNYQLNLYGRQMREDGNQERRGSVGRLVYAHPSSGERFYLRLLLNVVRGPTSYADIKNKDGIQYETFKETCVALRLLDDDNE
ncbi:uncharacterized protein LOC109838679 [Asparagus officinalis]|uniref:uncharacterized protein LOC109838679 n=1 Tax=Asparagus officinalis TaxID=4686 RepID=UPI00098E3650|nr:uncharacterized protein LOC109838679 [Asparagus officinalis]